MGQEKTARHCSPPRNVEYSFLYPKQEPPLAQLQGFVRETTIDAKVKYSLLYH